MKVKLFRKSCGELDGFTDSVALGEVDIAGEGDKVEEEDDAEIIGERIEGLSESKEYIFSGELELDEFDFVDEFAEFALVREVTFSCNIVSSSCGDAGADVVKGTWGTGISDGSGESIDK